MSRYQLKVIAQRFIREVRRDDVKGLAAELAYRFLFALFPFGLFVAALGAFVAGWLGVENPAEQIVTALGDNLPPDLAQSVQPELEQVMRNTRAGVLSFGALASLWAATGGTIVIIKAMNRAYGVEETRSTIHRYAMAVMLTITGAAIILLSFVTIVGGAFVTEGIAGRLTLSPASAELLSIARWPAVFLALVVATALLYRLAPNVRASWRWTFAGGAVFAIGWLAATYALGWYIGNIASYGTTYGSLGGMIVLMLWFYVTGLLLVGAAELIVVIAGVFEPEALQRRRDEIDERRSAGMELRDAGPIRSMLRRALNRARRLVPWWRARSTRTDDRAAAHAALAAAQPTGTGADDRRVGGADRRSDRDGAPPHH